MKKRIIAAMLVGAMLISGLTAGCGKGKEKSTESRSETTTDSTEASLDDTKETTDKTEAVTTAEDKDVTKETEAFTKEETNPETKEESKSETKPEAVTTKPAETKPAEIKPAPQATKAPATKPAETKPAPVETTKPTEAPKPTEPPTVNPKADWQTVTWVDQFEDTYTLYSNGEWYFDLVEDNRNPYKPMANNIRNCGMTSGIVLYKYLGNAECVNVPSNINGFPVKMLAYPFYENTVVKEVNIPKVTEFMYQAFEDSIVEKVTIETGSMLTNPMSWGAIANFETKDADGPNVYCDKAVADSIKSWYLCPVRCYSFDGNTIYYEG